MADYNATVIRHIVCICQFDFDLEYINGIKIEMDVEKKKK